MAWHQTGGGADNPNPWGSYQAGQAAASPSTEWSSWQEASASAQAGPAASPWGTGPSEQPDPWADGATSTSGGGAPSSAAWSQAPAQPSWDSGARSSWGQSSGDTWGQSSWEVSGSAGDEKVFGDFSDLGKDLKVIDWGGVALKAVEKDFYEEHPDVAARSEEECQAYRASLDIEILSEESQIPKPIKTFKESGLTDWILGTITSKNFKTPSAIQVQVWPVALQGRDLIGIAETGSGKTLAYLLPMMTHIMSQEELKAGEGPIGLVMCPTRELALQIDGVCREFSGPSGLKSVCVYGGSKVREQGWALQEKNDIVIATPGRFIHLLNDGWTNLNRVTYCVLDEADEMLDMGFGSQVELVMGQIRPDRQMLMFSATWPKAVSTMAKRHCKTDPVFIRVGGDRLAACKSVIQNVLVLPATSDKFDKLREALVRSNCHMRGSKHKCLIFCRSKVNVDSLVDDLIKHDIECRGLHSNKPQEERISSLDEFKNGELSCLASTQVLGRGHDIPRVRYVINYDAPDNIESYIHRVGRTGRAGEIGYAMTFLCERDHAISRDLIQVLESTDQKVPPRLRDLHLNQGSEGPWLQTSMHTAEEGNNSWDNYKNLAGDGGSSWDNSGNAAGGGTWA